MNDPRFWLAFSQVPEIGPRRIQHLLASFGSLEQAWTATESQLRQTGLEHRPLISLLSARQKLDPDSELRKVERAGASLVTLEDDDYPELLRKLPDAPPVLYVKGRLHPDDQRALSVVGTRRATVYGRDSAYNLSKQLAGCQVTVVSGLAHGIDSAAHRGALDGGGRTIAVLGCGIDTIYPRDNRSLAEAILQNGAIVTEFPVGTRPEGRNFPRRNRIISGMSLGVLVVEAPDKSGAIITAAIAAEQGREVFAVPGNIFSPTSIGTNRLIQDGAKLVMNVDDILDELNIAYENVRVQTTAERIAPSSSLETQVLDFLSQDPIHIDDLVRMSGLPVSILSGTLTILELKGLARAVGYMQYCLTPSSSHPLN